MDSHFRGDDNEMMFGHWSLRLGYFQPMFWRDRQHGGRELAEALGEYKNASDSVVIGLPRGGVVVAHTVAKALNLPLDIVVTRKIGAPGNAELALGAVDENGQGVFNEMLVQYSGATMEYLNQEIEEQKKEIERRLRLYRQRRPPLYLKGKAVIIVDDGVATGATMLAAARSCRNKGAKKIIVAAPTIAPDTLSQLQEQTDEVIFLDAPPDFVAVGQFYEEFEQVTDEEVIQLLSRSVGCTM